jgi:FMN phosphatase YigB (HAD superfamily)
LYAVFQVLDLDLLRRRRVSFSRLPNDSKEMSSLRRKKFGFDAIFNPIVISGNVGVKKADVRIYKLLLEKLRASAEECLFIDNNPSNIDAAQSLGIRTILFKNAEQLRRELL